MSTQDNESKCLDQIAIALTPEMRERLEWLASHRKQSADAMALELFSEELEAQYCMTKGIILRKHTYRS